MISRRTFLATLGAAAGVAACARTARSASAAGHRKLERIGIQLYTVRQRMRADMAGTLAAIGAMGYKEVEFAGYFGRAPKDVRAMLDASGLASPSMHIGYDELVANWDRVIDTAQTLGHQFLIVPSPPNGTRSTVASWQKVADDLSAAGERAKARGLTVGYHNHGSEFQAIEQTTAFEILLARSDPRFVTVQLDLYWAVSGGGDPKAILAKYPGRVTSLHIKDSSGPPHRQVDVGAGTIDFADILREDASLKAAVKHVFVEHDQPADPMAFAKGAFDYLSKLEY